MIYLVMGVSGSGKTLIGSLLAEKLHLSFIDADDLHPRDNIRKMRSGTPLTDRDRMPWLEKIADEMRGAAGRGGAVFACSALKHCYREYLRREAGREPGGEIRVIYLKGDYRRIRERMKQRNGHFFSAELLHSQFAVLEEPVQAITVSVSGTPEQIVRVIIDKLKAGGKRAHK